MRLLRVVSVALLMTAVGIALPPSLPDAPGLGWAGLAHADDECVVVHEDGNVTVYPENCTGN